MVSWPVFERVGILFGCDLTPGRVDGICDKALLDSPDMSSPASEHWTRIEQFKADLAALEVREVVRKHITTGMPAAIHADEYYELRRDVARHFGLHPSAVILVGSCRLGFALTRKKRWLPARAGSDLDLAIVSAERFDSYWEGVFEFARSDLAWTKTPE